MTIAHRELRGEITRPSRQDRIGVDFNDLNDLIDDINADNPFALSVRDYPFGATGDGVTNDTAAFNAAIAAANVAGMDVYVPAGNYLLSTLATLPVTGDLTIFGDGRTSRLVAAADSVIFFTLADAYAFSHKTFRGLAFDGNGGVDVRGIKCIRTRETKVLDCHFEDCRYNVLVDRCRGFWLTDISLRNSGCFFFHSTDDDDFCKQVVMTNVLDSVGTDIQGTYNVDAWIFLRDVVDGGLNNCFQAGMSGTTRGIVISGKCEGVFLYSCMPVWASICLELESDSYTAGTIRPQYISWQNCGFDQPSVSAAIIDGEHCFGDGNWYANGSSQNNTGDAVQIAATALDVSLTNSYCAFFEEHGVNVLSGARDINIENFWFSDNNGSAGAFFDINDASAFGELRVVGCTKELTSLSTNHRIVGGDTSSTVHRNTGAVSTTAVTTAEDLMSYSIAANALEPGMRVRLRAWGTTAANGNTKTLRLWFGSTSMGGAAGAFNTLPWELTAEVEITGANAQEYTRVGKVSTQSITIATATMTETDTSAIVVKIQGQNGTASAGDIVCQGFSVEILN